MCLHISTLRFIVVQFLLYLIMIHASIRCCAEQKPMFKKNIKQTKQAIPYTKESEHGDFFFINFYPFFFSIIIGC